VTDIVPGTDGECLRLHSSGGHLDTYQKAKFVGFQVWFNPASLANILSLALVTEEYLMTMNSELKNALVVHISAEHTISFVRHSPGLYYFDASSVNLYKLRHAFTFLTTVSDHKRLFGQRDLCKADDAVTLNRRANHMAKDKFIRVVKSNLIRNSPVTVGDVRRSHIIYGPPLPPIQGHTKYRYSPRFQENDIIEIPKTMFENLKHVVLCADFHYVDGVAVFHSISRKINYRTVSFPLSSSKGSIINELHEIFKIYNARGVKVVEVLGDSEFEKVETDTLPVRLRIFRTDSQVPKIERSVQT